MFWSIYSAAPAQLAEPLAAAGLSALLPTACAASAAVCVCAVRNPFEVVKQQMQAGLHSSTQQAVATILRSEGLRGFSAGYGSTVLREVPFDALQFSLYEALKLRAAAVRRRELVLWENCALGAVAGGCAAAATTPLDVVKTRLMTQTTLPAHLRYAGVRDCFSRILREEGSAVLFRGLRQRVAWISVGGSIFIGSFEEGKRQLLARL